MELQPVCPVCGEPADTYYYNKETGEIVGCPECVGCEDAWDMQPIDRI